MLISEADVLACFRPDTASSECVKELGYDIRLGRHVTLVTRGGTIELAPGQSLRIYPGETILAESLEVLRLPNNVCATGSPKMRLLIKGLWSHGGKTDFGYDQNLQLGFVNQGSEPIDLKYGDSIFNIIFWHVGGQPRVRKGIPVPQPGHTSPSRLEALHLPNRKFRKSVLRRDGIQAFRMLNLVQAQQHRFTWALGYTSVAFIVVIGLAASALALPSQANAFVWGQMAIAGLALLATLVHGILTRNGRAEPDTADAIEKWGENS